MTNTKLPHKNAVLTTWCTVFIALMSYWAFLYHEAGNFNKTILDRIKQFDQKSFLFVNMPTSAYSNIPLISCERFMEEAIWYFYKKDVSVGYAARRMINNLPCEVNISKSSGTVLNLHADRKNYDYYQIKYQNYEIKGLKDIRITGTDIYKNATDVAVYLESDSNVFLVEP